MSYYERDEALTLAYNTLQDIAEWRTPGKQFYKNGDLMSFESANGSNGVRDFFKAKAQQAVDDIELLRKSERKAFNIYIDGQIVEKTDWYDRMLSLVQGYGKDRNIVIKDGYGCIREELNEIFNK